MIEEKVTDTLPTQSPVALWQQAVDIGIISDVPVKKATNRHA